MYNMALPSCAQCNDIDGMTDNGLVFRCIAAFSIFPLNVVDVDVAKMCCSVNEASAHKLKTFYTLLFVVLDIFFLHFINNNKMK